MTTHDPQIIISAVADLELIAAEELSSAVTDSYAERLEHSIRIVNDATEELLFRREERVGLEARIATLNGVIEILGADLNAMRQDRDRVSTELEQVQAELRVRGELHEME